MKNEQALVAVQPEEGGQLLEFEFVDGPAAEPEEEISGEEHPNFIESNTAAISLEDLATKSVVPTFSDNSLTIAHQSFIACVAKAASEVFGEITPIECRVSHPIIGRVPTALHKKASELTEDEKTVFYQRMAFVSRVYGLIREIDGHSIHLVIGGVRAYNEDRRVTSRMVDIIQDTVPERKLVYGINGLAELLCCSLSTANRIKSSHIIDPAVSQVNRTIVIDAQKALELLSSSKSKWTDLGKTRLKSLKK